MRYTLLCTGMQAVIAFLELLEDIRDSSTLCTDTPGSYKAVPPTLLQNRNLLGLSV